MSKIVPIHSVDDLINTEYMNNVTYRLENDLEIDSNFQPIQNFKGIFDGNGKTITIRSFGKASRDFYGIFVQNSGLIKNLTVKVETTELLYAYLYGTIAVYNFGAIINCNVRIEDLRVSSSKVKDFGGVVCVNYGIIKDTNFVGRIELTPSVYSSSITLGGLVSTTKRYALKEIYIESLGVVDLSNIRKSVSYNVESFLTKFRNRYNSSLRQLISDLSAIMTNCNSLVILEGVKDGIFGGIIGCLERCIVDSCFSVSLVLSSKNSVLGGVCGKSSGMNVISNCVVFTKQESIDGVSGGVVGKVDIYDTEKRLIIDSVVVKSWLQSCVVGGLVGISNSCLSNTGVYILNSSVSTKHECKVSSGLVIDSKNIRGGSGGVIGISRNNLVFDTKVNYELDGSFVYSGGLFGKSKSDCVVNVDLNLNTKNVSTLPILSDCLCGGTIRQLNVKASNIDLNNCQFFLCRRITSISVLKDIVIDEKIQPYLLCNAKHGENRLVFC